MENIPQTISKSHLIAYFTEDSLPSRNFNGASHAPSKLDFKLKNSAEAHGRSTPYEMTSGPLSFGNITYVDAVPEFVDHNQTEEYHNETGTWEEILPPEFKEIVPKHWLKFRPPPPEIHYTLGAIYILIMTTGLFGNFCIIWLFFTTKALRTPSHYLVINLAFCDSLILSKMPIFIYNSFSLGPAAGLWWCQYYGTVGGLSGTSAIMSIAAMAAERYMTISRPLDPSSRMTRSRAVCIVLGVWIYSLTFSIPPLVGLNRYVPEGYLTSCSFDYLSDGWKNKVFILSFFVAAWCVPLLIVCCCYVGIVLSVRQSQRLFEKHARKMDTENRNVEKQRKIEIKLAKISFCLISLWTLSWTPYAAVALMGLFSDRSSLKPITSMVPALFCKVASVLDPYVYGLTSNRFKSEIKRRISRDQSTKSIGSRRSTTHAMRTISQPQESRDTPTSEEEGEDEEEEKEEEVEVLAEDYELCNLDDPPSPPLSVHIAAPEEYDTVGKTIEGHVEPCTSSDPSRSNEQVKNIEIYFIPQMYNMQEQHDEIKMRFRRSL